MNENHGITSASGAIRKFGKESRNKSKDYIFKKRNPQKPELDNSVLYINTKTPLKAFIERTNKLIKDGEAELSLYCLGAAIQRGILLALKVTEEHPTWKIHTHTFTTELLDDLEPATDDADYQVQRRLNSALRIRLFKSDPLEVKQLCSSLSTN